MLPPFSAFSDERINQLDLRLSRIFRMKTTRLQANVDLYNAMNASTVLGLNNTFSTAGQNNWQQPTQILDARLLKVSVQMDF